MWKKTNMKKPMQQQGFTLIELMISIVLGLLVTAAALAIFLSAQRSLNMQTGMSELQQNSIFGLSQLARDLRHINLDMNNNKNMKIDTANSGIVFSTENSSNTTQITKLNTTSTNMTINSDELVIQYIPHGTNMVNCEGTQMTQAVVNVQHYYLEESASGSGRYNLICDAGYSGTGGTVLGANKQVILQDVEAFKVRFGIKNGDKFQYINRFPQGGEIVMSVEVGVIARSSNTVASADVIDNDKEYTIAGTTMKLKDAAKNKGSYLREPFSQVVAIRNGQGE